MATQARAKELVILEVQVDVQGVVKSVRVLRGHPLFDEPAMDAVRQWRAAAAERRAGRMPVGTVVEFVWGTSIGRC